MKTKRLATWKYIVSLTLSVLCILIALFVEITAADFAMKSIAISKAETEGYTPTHVMGGTVTWTKDQKETYNSAVKAKETLIAANDVAKFFSDLGGSTTGEIFRWVVTLALMPMWINLSWKFFYAAICILYGRFDRWWENYARPAWYSFINSIYEWWKKFSVECLIPKISKICERFSKKNVN